MTKRGNAKSPVLRRYVAAWVFILACNELPQVSDPASVFGPGVDAWSMPDAGLGSESGAADGAMDGPGPNVDAASNPACEPVTVFAAIVPLLRGCTDCHDSGGEAGLDLTSHAGLLRGGASGPALVAGDCRNSLLWLKTGPTPPFGSRMPLGGNALSAAERDLLCRFIDDGAPAVPPPCDAAMGGDAGAALADIDPPRFEGVDRVEESAGTCLLQWPAARDDTTPAAAITYLIYVAPEGQAFPAEPALQVTGQLAATLTPAPGQDYEIQVLARDAAGNVGGGDRVRKCSLD